MPNKNYTDEEKEFLWEQYKLLNKEADRLQNNFISTIMKAEFEEEKEILKTVCRGLNTKNKGDT